jgi:diguanylate cyclase (GGDEF)-like protein/PAS domain S-box-containing protein
MGPEMHNRNRDMSKVDADSPDQAQPSFSDLVDLAAYAQVLEQYHRACGIGVCVRNPQGQVLCQAGWSNAPAAGTGTPVRLGDRTLATIFLHPAATMAHEQVLAHAQNLVSMAEMLIAAGMTSWRQDKLLHRLNQTNERRVELEDILGASPVAIGWSDASGRIEYVNAQLTTMFGYTLPEIPDIPTWFAKAYPDADYRRNVIAPWWADADRILADGDLPRQLESDITCKNGRVLHATMHVSRVGNRHLVVFSDETEKWENLQRMRAHDAMLEMVARGTPLNDILNTIARQVEQEDPTALCSILLLDDDKRHLHTIAAPSLPANYLQAIDGIETGPYVGSCGAAAYLGKRVVADDVATHPNWQNYQPLAQMANIRSCWSEPIMSTTQQVMGTFAIYHHEVCSPTDKDIERIAYAANLCAVAIEHRQALGLLEQRAYSDPLTGLANRRAFIERASSELARTVRHHGMLSLLMMDIDHFKRVNDTHGHGAGDLVLQAVSAVCEHAVRAGDLVSRIGGEEFAILLPDTGPERAMEIAERLREALAEHITTLEDGSTVNVTASLGVTTLQDHDSPFETLLEQADQAMYRAKRQGRNQVCRFDPERTEAL